VVEHDLAKVGVEGSNPFARSKFSSRDQGLSTRPLIERAVCFSGYLFLHLPPAKAAMQRAGKIPSE
jgi:hypothetical protein